MMRRQTPRPARPHHRNRLTPRLGRPWFVNGFRMRMSSWSGAQSVHCSRVYRPYVIVTVAWLPMSGVEVRSFRHSVGLYSIVVPLVVDVARNFDVEGVRRQYFLVPILLLIVLRLVVSQYRIIQGR